MPLGKCLLAAGKIFGGYIAKFVQGSSLADHACVKVIAELWSYTLGQSSCETNALDGLVCRNSGRLRCREDDDLRTTLRAHLAALRPVEVVIPTGVGAWSLKILKANMQAGRINKLQAGRDFWTAAETISYLETKEYYQGCHLDVHMPIGCLL